MMRPYLALTRTAYLDGVRYTADIWVRVLLSLLRGYASVALWWGIQNASRQPDLGPVVPYMILSVVFNTMFRTLPESQVTEAIRSGDITRHLVNPLAFPQSLFCRSMGGVASVFVVQCLPLLVALMVLFGTDLLAHASHLPGLLLGFALAYLLFFCINLSIDLLSFWIQETYFFRYPKTAILWLFSGSLVPVWLYPQWLENLIRYLPFQGLYSSPISYFLGRMELDLYLQSLGITLAWTLVFGWACRTLWLRGLQQLHTNGG